MSWELIKDLTDKRMKCFTTMKELVMAQETDKRSLTAEEDATFKKMNADIETYKVQIDAEKKKLDNAHAVEVLEAEMYAAAKKASAGGPQLTVGDTPNAAAAAIANEKTTTEAAKEKYARQMEGLALFIRGDISARKAKDLAQFDLSQDSMTQGGYAVRAPIQYAKELLLTLRDMTIIRQLADVMPALSSPGGWGQLTGTGTGRPTRVGERQRAAFDNTLSFGQREMFTHDQELVEKITNKLLSNPNADMLEMVKALMGESFADEQEYEFILGDGVRKPIGFMYPSAKGVPSSRHFSSGHTDSTHIGIDNFLLLPYKVHERLRAGGVYLVHSDIVYLLRTLKSALTGEYYWQPSVQAGVPDKFGGYSVYTSNKMPSTVTSGALVGCFANFKEYKILDSDKVLMSIEEHLYWETKETGISMTMYNDGQPRRQDAFAISKMP